MERSNEVIEMVIEEEDGEGSVNNKLEFFSQIFVIFFFQAI